jgi:hypothetical protein
VEWYGDGCWVVLVVMVRRTFCVVVAHDAETRRSLIDLNP